MENILDSTVIDKNPSTRNKEAFYFCIARLLERAAYYGIRALLVLYMVSETIKMPREEAMKIYGWLTLALFFSQILGGVLGDLVIGNKKSIIIGAVLQALGAFILCFTSITTIYIAIGLIVIGGGLYSPNIIANFGKIYYHKKKLLDASYMMLNLSVNVGAFLGVLAIGFIGESLGWHIGFIIAGVMLLISILPILGSKERTNEISKSFKPLNQSILKIVIGIFLAATFWQVYELSNAIVYPIQLQLAGLTLSTIPQNLWLSINPALLVPISIAAIIIYSKIYTSQFVKLFLGFAFGLIALLSLKAIPEGVTEAHLLPFLLVMFFFALAEIHIAPIVHSILAQYANPKYLATVVGISNLPYKLITFVMGFMAVSDEFDSQKIITTSMILISIIILGLIVFIQKIKKEKLT